MNAAAPSMRVVPPVLFTLLWMAAAAIKCMVTVWEMLTLELVTGITRNTGGFGAGMSD